VNGVMHNGQKKTGGPDGAGEEARRSHAVPKVSIVIPIYNEEGILRSAVVDLVERLADFPYPYEILLSENGSRDATAKIAGELEKTYPQLRHLSIGEPNYGKALRRGILEARGELVICDEIDLCDVDFYARAMELLEANEADLVIGSKTLPGSHDKRPLMRRAATKVINGMLRVALDFRGTDTHGLKAMRRKALEPIVNTCLVDKDLFASELVIRAGRGGVRVREIPVVVIEKRKPTIRLTKRVPNVLRHLAILFWSIRIRG
jgi:glycosyltransferase involved in cell wall biosynthesis